MGKRVVINVLTFIYLLFCGHTIMGQEVSIQNYSTNDDGQVQLTVNSTVDHYYILMTTYDLESDLQLATSITRGSDNLTLLTEPLRAYPLTHYRVLEYPIDTPYDIDEDGVDDITELDNFPVQSPLNFADPIDAEDGYLMIDDFSTFRELSITKETVQWSEFLNGKSYVKFMIVDFETSHPKVYFIDSENHNLHADFGNAAGIDHVGDHVIKGQIIYHPTTISDNGTFGTFTFNYSNGKGKDFDVVQRSHELLAANMPFVNNNLSHYITSNNEDEYERDEDLFQNSRIPVLFEADIFEGIDYWGLNPAEGFGYFRKAELEDIPGPKDIVLYESLPNSLPRVGGIMTSIIQTPLSHVNLRAIQNEIPNAFIRDALDIDSIASLLDHYIYFRVDQDGYTIREASLAEVNEWYEDIRPVEEQTPSLNLEYVSILPLDDISFDMFDGFGAKCSNIATMRTFGFPDKTIPDGFGVPFHFYQSFMEDNQFFDIAENLINRADFVSDRVTRDSLLKDFRRLIKDAEMPDWMMEELDDMHRSFPAGTSIRCRSSTNNEDLPGFNGAGLYTSKTQHPDEGHISKSIKQVYASLWNLRAFEEREFYRINHFVTSMGVLCHPNYSEELVNGVGVSIDPIYSVENTFYLNSQVGEELITNPEGASIPEEILLDRESNGEDDYIVVQYSSLAPDNTIIMEEQYLDQMREYLTVIHDEFELLYQAEDNESFAMDIEYKVTSDGQLIIKQARPWASYIKANEIVLESPVLNLTKIYPNPASEVILLDCEYCDKQSLKLHNMMGQQLPLELLYKSGSERTTFHFSCENLPSGVYVISGISNEHGESSSAMFVKR